MPLSIEYAYSSCIGPVELHLADGRVVDQAHITKMMPGAMTARKPSFRARLGGRIHDAPKLSAGAKASYVEFLVPQLKTQKGRPIRYGQGLRCARHKLTGGDWSITLDELKNCDDTWKELEKNSGYGVTHVGRLHRADNAPFDSETTRHVLRGLGWYLSFASGRWTGPVLTRGFDASGGLLWDLWDAWRIVSCVERETWIKPHMTEQFEEPFTGFFKAWDNPNLTEVIEIAMHWHVEANGQAGSIEGAIVLTQAALEMLASTMPVAKHAGMSKNAFDSLAAGERTKRLFEWAGIPTTLLPAFRDLAAVVSIVDPENWTTS
jgi:hypothetical protein